MEAGPMNGSRTNEWKQNQYMETGPMNGNRTNKWKQDQRMETEPMEWKHEQLEQKNDLWKGNRNIN